MLRVRRRVGWEGEIIRQNYSDMLSQQVLTWSNFLLSLLLSHASSTSFSTPLEIHKLIAGVHLHEIFASGNSFCEVRADMGVQVYFRALPDTCTGQQNQLGYAKPWLSLVPAPGMLLK